jgi:riboflavin kinase/FMN adenylyltransferase
MNIGYRPTVSNEHDLKLEVHVLDFDEDLYGQNLSILCFKRMRDERKFVDIAALKDQLTVDKTSVLDYFSAQC